MKHEEDDLQMATAALVRAAVLPGVLAWHTPNGGRRSKREAGRFKAMGVRAGVPDWTIVWSANQCSVPIVLFVELKSSTGRSSDEQKVFAAEAEAAGCAYEIARSLDGFLEILARRSVPMRKVKVAA